MRNFILRRFLLMGVVLLGVSILTFLISHVVPGDPARLAAGPQARAAQVETIRKKFGLDKPLPTQYLIYMRNLFKGDLGMSLQSRRPVAEDLADYFPATLELTLVATLITIAVGIPLGLVSAIRKDMLVDHLTRVLSLAGVSMPVFWLGLLLILVFYKGLGWFPIGGRLGSDLSTPQRLTGLYILDSLLTLNWPTLSSAVQYIVLPALTLAYGSLAVVTRMTRASLLEVFGDDYIRTARAKGLMERMVLYRHALKNALIPILTVLGLQVGALLGGIFLVEVIFSWPGIGTYAMKAIVFLDYNGIMGVTLLTALVFMIINFVIDILYAYVDPRIRYQ